MSFHSRSIKVCSVSNAGIKQKRISAPLLLALSLLPVCFLCGCGGGVLSQSLREPRAEPLT